MFVVCDSLCLKYTDDSSNPAINKPVRSSHHYHTFMSNVLSNIVNKIDACLHVLLVSIKMSLS